MQRAAGKVGRVLNLDQARSGAKTAPAIDDRLDVLPGQCALPGRDRTDEAAGKHGRRGHLPIEDVGARFADDLLPRLRVQAKSDLIAHGAGGNKERGFPAEAGRGPALQQVDRGILTIDVVAHFGGGHGSAHLRRGAGHGVRT